MQQQGFEIILNGGLGNQLFGWALGKSLTMRHGIECRYNSTLIEGREFELGQFGIEPSYEKPYQSASKLHLTCNRIAQKMNLRLRFPRFVERSFRFDPEFLKPKPHSSYYGYFQSYKYFWEFHGEIKNLLKTNFAPSSEAQDALEFIQSRNFYALHARRGDYLERQDFHGITSEVYFAKARDRILAIDRDARFLLFSDSPNLAQREIPWALFEPEITDGFTPAETLMLMSNSKGIVGSNSSFSWWASFLMQDSAIRFFPKPWFVNKSIDTEDLLPPGWNQLDNS